MGEKIAIKTPKTIWRVYFFASFFCCAFVFFAVLILSFLSIGFDDQNISFKQIEVPKLIFISLINSIIPTIYTIIAVSIVFWSQYGMACLLIDFFIIDAENPSNLPYYLVGFLYILITLLIYTLAPINFYSSSKRQYLGLYLFFNPYGFFLYYVFGYVIWKNLAAFIYDDQSIIKEM